MLQILCNTVWLCRDFFVDMIVYKTVEFGAKRFLANASNLQERQVIAVLECAVLFFLCAILYFDHVPYFLFFMACLMMLYTFFLHKLDFQSYWQIIRTTWQDYLDFSDRATTASTQSQPGTTAATGAPPPPPPPPSSQSQANTAPILPAQPSSPTSAPGTGGGSPQVRSDAGAAAPSSVPTTPTGPALFRKQTTRSTSQLPGSQPGNNAGTAASSVPIACVPPNARKFGARPNRTFSTDRFTGAASIVTSKMNKVASWIKHTIVRDATIPPGLVNYSHENLCFINCILQTLSRSPQLLESLESAVNAAPMHDPKYLAFIRQVVDVFHRLTVPGNRTHEGNPIYVKTLDTRMLRRASSVVCKTDLIVDPLSDKAQHQQDAAEFLLWILDNLHDTLNIPSAPGSGSSYARPAIRQPQGNPYAPHSTPRNSAQVALDKLNSTYGCPSNAMIMRQKQQCQADLATSANGQDKSTYIHLVTRLADLDWLLYKSTNNSLVNDLFCGQVVAASCCLTCYRMSISTETFRILTVPIPLEVETINVDECFKQLLDLETFTPQNRPIFDACKCLTQNITSTPNGPRTGVAPPACPPGMDAMSPINGVNRDQVAGPATSTPVPVNPLLSTTYANCQRQTSLQRLPECLAVQLLRFAYTNQQDIKLNTQVKVSVDPIDLSPLIIVRNTHLEPLYYSLYGVCMHANSSSTQSGHYFSYALANDGQWYLFNDSTVSKVDIEHELNKKEVQENVYILYYHRVAVSSSSLS